MEGGITEGTEDMENWLRGWGYGGWELRILVGGMGCGGRGGALGGEMNQGWGVWVVEDWRLTWR